MALGGVGRRTLGGALAGAIAGGLYGGSGQDGSGGGFLTGALLGGALGAAAGRYGGQAFRAGSKMKAGTAFGERATRGWGATKGLFARDMRALGRFGSSVQGTAKSAWAAGRAKAGGSKASTTIQASEPVGGRIPTPVSSTPKVEVGSRWDIPGLSSRTQGVGLLEQMDVGGGTRKYGDLRGKSSILPEGYLQSRPNYGRGDPRSTLAAARDLTSRMGVSTAIGSQATLEALQGGRSGRFIAPF